MHERPAPKDAEEAKRRWLFYHRPDDGTAAAFWASIGWGDVLLGCIAHGRVPASKWKFPCDEQPAHCEPVEIIWPLDLPQEVRDEVEALDEKWYFEEMAFEAADQQVQAEEETKAWEEEKWR